MTPDDHNYLDFSAVSPYTSWTHSLPIAASFARSRGAGGIVLRIPLGKPNAKDTWSWEFSPDTFGEQEVLLKGIRIGVEVMHVDAWANS